jgi:hypothetical protein
LYGGNLDIFPEFLTPQEYSSIYQGILLDDTLFWLHCRFYIVPPETKDLLVLKHIGRILSDLKFLATDKCKKGKLM